MKINVFPHLSDTFSMKRYLSGVVVSLRKEHDVQIYSPVKENEKISLAKKYPAYLAIARKARAGYNLILSERFTFLLLTLKRKQSFVVCHDLITLLNPNASSIHKIWYRLLLRMMASAKKIICISEQTKRDLLSFCRFIPKDKIRVVYNGIESFWFEDAKEDVDTLTQVSGQRYFLMVGTDAWNKNFDLIIEALKLFRDPEFKLVKVGTLTQDHRQKLSRAGLEDSVIVFNKLSDRELKHLYQHAISLLFPSLHEGFGWPVLEAMACGCPVIASSVSSIPEVGGDAPLYIDPRNPETIKQAMMDLLSDENKRQAMIFSGKLQASKFSWEKTAAALENVFSEAGNQ